jgi:hypothetical protein
MIDFCNKIYIRCPKWETLDIKFQHKFTTLKRCLFWANHANFPNCLTHDFDSKFSELRVTYPFSSNTFSFSSLLAIIITKYLLNWNKIIK